LIGLIVTLAAVIADGWYISRQMAGLRSLQTDLADRNRRDSLQLLRIQNDLNTVALAMRDMIDSTEYPLTAWTAQFARVRQDLEDALRREEAVAVAQRTPEQRLYLASSVSQFWDAVDRMFAEARAGRDENARSQIRVSLQARQAALSTAVARLLVANNESEEQTARQVQDIYSQVQRQAFVFLGGTLVAILLTSLYVIRSNRRLFVELAALSERRQELAQQLITARESTLSEISRELHDEFGQILTAMGSMLARAGKHAPEGSPLRTELREVNEIAQTALENVRGLSQTLHPSILEDAGPRRHHRLVRAARGTAARHPHCLPAQRFGGVDGQQRRGARLPRAAGSPQQRRAAFRGAGGVGAAAGQHLWAIARSRRSRQGARCRDRAARPRYHHDARARRAGGRRHRIHATSGWRNLGAADGATMITVLLADDHTLVRRGFRRMLEDDAAISVVGEAGDGDEAIQLAAQLKPKVVVMDCAMPRTSGLVATRKILETDPNVAVLMLSMHAEETLVARRSMPERAAMF
jgi:CheY-like chemotaxis protein/signal transduction histidine kinase